MARTELCSGEELQYFAALGLFLAEIDSRLQRVEGVGPVWRGSDDIRYLHGDVRKQKGQDMEELGHLAGNRPQMELHPDLQEPAVGAVGPQCREVEVLLSGQ